MKKRDFLIVAAFVFTATIVVFMATNRKTGAEVEPLVIEPLTESWEKAIEYQEIPEGLGSLSAETCGACHQDHYAEWKTSTHAHAWTDMQFQAEIKKESSPYLCINCHIPLENQQEFIVDGLIEGDVYRPSQKKNYRWDVNLQKEGITCAACHVRNNAVIGPTGTDKAPHKTVKDPKFLSETLCISCHNAVAAVTPEIACAFETGDEWKAGPFANEKNCIACHMEEVTRSVVPGYPERKSHYHSFPGSGIPKVTGAETTSLNGFEFYPGELKSHYRSNQKIQYRFDVKNEHAGHRLPTGDPERFVLFKFFVVNEKGETVWKKTERIGEKWQWYPTAKKLEDNNLDPKERRSFELLIDELPIGSYTFNVKVTKHRMDEKTAAFNKLTERYPMFINLFDSHYSFRVMN